MERHAEDMLRLEGFEQANGLSGIVNIPHIYREVGIPLHLSEDARPRTRHVSFDNGTLPVETPLKAGVRYLISGVDFSKWLISSCQLRRS
jgi:hypothetical protein